MSCLRNVVARGVLSAAKAKRLRLESVCDYGVVVLHTLILRLLGATFGSVEVSHG